jgi:hypothetical protein
MKENPGDIIFHDTTQLPFSKDDPIEQFYTRNRNTQVEQWICNRTPYGQKQAVSGRPPSHSTLQQPMHDQAMMCWSSTWTHKMQD